MANFIKYKDELVNLELCTNISLYNYDGGDYFIFFRGEGLEGKRSIITSFGFKTEKERDEYFLKIQERIEKIQGFKIDLEEESELEDLEKNKKKYEENIRNLLAENKVLYEELNEMERLKIALGDKND